MKTKGIVNLCKVIFLSMSYSFNLTNNWLKHITVSGNVYLYVFFIWGKYTPYIYMGYSCGNMQNKPNGICYRDLFNQMCIMVLVLSNTIINISTNTNFEQIMVDFSINWLYKVFHQPNFGLGFKEIGIDFEQALWLPNWH